MIHDISRPLSVSTAVYPGDTPFGVRQVMRMADGAACDVSTVTMSVHTGTHVDAPSHFRLGSTSVDRLPLEVFCGPARVVGMPTRTGITTEQVAGLALAGVSRLLLQTGSVPDSSVYNEDFAHLTVEAARALVAAGLCLVGIDTPSIDRWDSKTLEAHKVLLDGGVAILENLWLDEVAAGDYELIALPLKLVGLDASPVRAVLRAPASS